MEKTLRKLLIEATGIDDIVIEIPKDEVFGDLSTPVAMGLARIQKRPPREIAGDIINAVKKLASSHEGAGIFEKTNIAGPGYINFTFADSFIHEQLKRLILKKDGFLVEDIGKGKRIQIEFVSANPTGPLHLGHGRGAAIGGALANLLKEAGYSVEREYYINDAGRQVKLLGMSVFSRCMQLLGKEYPFPEDGYHGEYVEDLAREYLEVNKGQIQGKAFEEASDAVIHFSYKKMLDVIRRDLADFGIFFETWQSEREMYEKGEVTNALHDLQGRGYIYEEGGAEWFRSTLFGDDKDRVVLKNDGDYTYFAPDIAYHRKKIQKGFDEIIDIWGADHHGYIPRIRAVIRALGYPDDHLAILIVQMVTLLRGGKPVQMSKRAGEFITLREVMDEIGADTTKFLFLTRRPDSQLEIDIEVAKAQSQENPVYYVQYVHARISSIFKKAREESGIIIEDMIKDFDGALYNEEERRIIKKLLLYPMMFRNAVLTHEPHRITFYLQELAGIFHPYYQKCRVISDDMALTKARLALCEAIRIVIRHGLKILGVNAPDKM
ncbi:arginine--tRNA ligase [bacterium]|nr:arginine--tRNA ligase [bacterium]